MKKENWHGSDDNLATSLFKHGLIIRFLPKSQEWQIIYRNPNEKFSYATVAESELKEILISGWAKSRIQDFLKYCGMSFLEWLEQPVVLRLEDMFSYFGVAEFFTDYSGGYSALEICHDLGIEYKKEYEET